VKKIQNAVIAIIAATLNKIIHRLFVRSPEF